ncbi:MAG: T9SS type A sorting domain-containing protein, partial [candidate division Zixibacteria bacterium]|nr:T9SS type A sorting domain-containing protein [candidate division Zixibacteria bacterium]
DNLYQLEKNSSYGDGGDPFPGSSGQTLFSNITFPSSRSYSGSNTLVAVNNISSSATIMTADLVVALVADVDDYISDPILPEGFTLGQNYPNPFNPTTSITFDLPAAAAVKLSIYNAIGQQVEALLDGTLPAGRHQVDWTAADQEGTSRPSGVYFYRLIVNGSSLTRKMMLLK